MEPYRLEQRTIARRADLCGIGLHTGEACRLEIHPSEPDTGVVFVRTDLPGRPRVAASLENLTAKARRTALAAGDAEVHTTEHLLAALSGAGIHNVEVWLDGPEVPGMDGSALPFLEAIEAAGKAPQGRPAAVTRIIEPVTISEQGASLTATSPPTSRVAGQEDSLTLAYTLDYSGLRPGADAHGFLRQELEVTLTPEVFAREIAPARTFVFEEEVAALRAAGLGKGANPQNTLILGKAGIIENRLRFPDEPVRHKILDLLGDLALTGTVWAGKVAAVKSGHALNVRLAMQVRKLTMEVEV